jgi:transcriptional regulator GlxA family with amidase domain
LAAIATMSTRNFTRVFTREMNMTPMEFVQNARVDRARVAGNQRYSDQVVAYRSGFGSDRRMRVLFNEKLGLTPVQYRQQFG